MKELNQSGPEGDRNPKLNQEILQEMMQLGEKANVVVAVKEEDFALLTKQILKNLIIHIVKIR